MLYMYAEYICQVQLSYCYQGDSGGPISCGVNGRYYVMGAASWVASGCTTPGYPSVYTRVSKYLDWINEKTA